MIDLLDLGFGRGTDCRSDKFEIVAEGEGADDVPRDESNLVVTGTCTSTTSSSR